MPVFRKAAPYYSPQLKQKAEILYAV